MCAFLGISANEDYLNSCSSVIRDSYHRSREEVDWSRDSAEFIMSRIGDYDFLEGYSFDN